MWKDGKQEMLIEGPFTQESSLRSLELVDDINFVYVCTKPLYVQGQEAVTESVAE